LQEVGQVGETVCQFDLKAALSAEPDEGANFSFNFEIELETEVRAAPIGATYSAGQACAGLAAIIPPLAIRENPNKDIATTMRICPTLSFAGRAASTAVVVIIWFLLPAPVARAWQADLGDGRYQNPVLFADYSDPDVIRVGSDFYMVSSSFHFMPGIPILTSKDLVNWTIIGHVYQRFAFDPAYNLNGGDGDRYGGGCWAPVIRYHGGRFWVYFPTPNEGIFMSTAKLAAGPWAPLVQVKKVSGWEDPCPFWDDDGKAYLAHSVLGAGPLILHRLSPDGTQLLDEGTNIVNDPVDLPVLEGPKMYKMRGYYYIFAPAGGVGQGWQAVLRSTNVYGPYESHRVLDQGDTTINGPHQGAYVETPEGQPWFVHFQSRDSYGRIFWLEPVRWTNGWPVIGSAPAGITTGHPVLTWAKPEIQGRTAIQIPQTSDEFNSETLGLQWQWNHNPDNSKWSLTDRPGYLSLRATPAESLVHARNTLTEMLADPAVTITTLLDPRRMADGQRAGLCMFGDPAGWIGVVQNEGQKRIGYVTGNHEVLGPSMSNASVYLRVNVNNGLATFSYSLDGDIFVTAGEPVALRSSWWKGARPGLFSFNNSGKPPQSTGVADFDWFHYEPKN
jgi:beta-xylosidase